MLPNQGMHTSSAADVLGSFDQKARSETYRDVHIHMDGSIPTYIYTHICKQKTTNMLPTFPVAVLFLLRLAWMLRLDLILEIKIRYP